MELPAHHRTTLPAYLHSSSSSSRSSLARDRISGDQSDGPVRTDGRSKGQRDGVFSGVNIYTKCPKYDRLFSDPLSLSLSASNLQYSEIAEIYSYISKSI